MVRGDAWNYRSGNKQPKPESERERVGTSDEQFIEQLRTVGLVRAAERMRELLTAVAAEREACAALCDAEHKWLSRIVDRDGAGAAAQCAHKIRARGGDA